MCGIFAALSTRNHVSPSSEHQQSLQSRGPDSTGQKFVTVKQENTENSLHLTLWSTVLSLRGDQTTAQPLTTPSGSSLCWNGEAWTVNGLATHGNDTSVVADLLSTISRQRADATTRDGEVRHRATLTAEALARVTGPYAFVFHDAANNLLFFGRDFLGRRSLLLRQTSEGDTLLCSIAVPTPHDRLWWREVDADGLYCCDLRSYSTELKDYPLQDSFVKVSYPTNAIPERAVSPYVRGP
jgi:asparagine synthetase B (glutamine-hydrolysing)